MFDRRRRGSEPLPTIHTHRHLRAGETIPSLPGLLDQMVAFRMDVERARAAPVIDELEMDHLIEDDDDLED